MRTRRIFALLVSATLAAGCVSPNLSPEPEFFARPGHPELVPAAVETPSLRVLTLNIAHGRGNGFHQALQNADKARENLDSIESLIRREKPDVVALQEADAPSAWSGGFDHVDYVARAAKFGWGVHAAHAEGAGLSYGTAVISRLPMDGHDAHTFTPAKASLPKGFSLATVDWMEAGMSVDVVSVHLEPIRKAVRHKQARELVAALRDRQRPLVIMGDMNTEWNSKDGVLKTIVEELDLQAYVPEHEDAVTYPRLGKRLDWILVSREFRFTGLTILNDPISDHRAVIANLEPIEDHARMVSKRGEGT